MHRFVRFRIICVASPSIDGPESWESSRTDLTGRDSSIPFLAICSIFDDVRDFPLGKRLKMGTELPGHSDMARTELQGFIFRSPYGSIFEVRRRHNLGCFEWVA